MQMPLAAFEKGVGLVNYWNQKLTEVEKKVELLVKDKEASSSSNRSSPVRKRTRKISGAAQSSRSHAAFPPESTFFSRNWVSHCRSVIPNRQGHRLAKPSSAIKRTNFDRYLEEQLKDTAFAARFECADDAWDVSLQVAALLDARNVLARGRKPRRIRQPS